MPKVELDHEVSRNIKYAPPQKRPYQQINLTNWAVIQQFESAESTNFPFFHITLTAIAAHSIALNSDLSQMIHLHVDGVQHLEFQIVETNAMRLPATPSMGSLRLKPSGSFRIGYKARIHICTNDAICDIFKCIYIVVSYTRTYIIYIYTYFFNFIPHRIQGAPKRHVQPLRAFLPD